ncbi:allantoicase [Acrasis kona]|uniref:Allantoicase n=1 Tax=Acrasis kona TaxID=1008807 RepID=A0AAW2YW30_9EUKA
MLSKVLPLFILICVVFGLEQTSNVGERPAFVNNVNLLSSRVGASVVSYSDQFFAEAENLLNPIAPVFKPQTFTDRGQLMDGWETRRHNPNEYDWVILKLGLRGTISGFMIDTAFFTGNHGPQASIEAIHFDNANPLPEELEKSDKWVEVLPKVDLLPGFINQSQHYFDSLTQDQMWTHLRLKMYPDGGIARFKAFGKVLPDWDNMDPTQEIDLAFVGNGASVVAVSDMYFSSKDNIIMPGRGINMGDGWETKRSRTKGHVDWLIIKLGRAAKKINSLEIDTAHFKGNYPESCIVEVANLSDSQDVASAKWSTLLPRTKLSAHNQHIFDVSVDSVDNALSTSTVTHVKLTIIPDGGVSRLRVRGLFV